MGEITFDKEWQLGKWHREMPDYSAAYSKWQPIETAPSTAKSALFYCYEFGIYGTGELHGTASIICSFDGSMFLASHWMPLPEPPK